MDSCWGFEGNGRKERKEGAECEGREERKEIDVKEGRGGW